MMVVFASTIDGQLKYSIDIEKVDLKYIIRDGTHYFLIILMVYYTYSLLYVYTHYQISFQSLLATMIYMFRLLFNA